MASLIRSFAIMTVIHVGSAFQTRISAGGSTPGPAPPQWLNTSMARF